MLDPRPNLSRRARQGLANPHLQLFLPGRAQMAHAARIAEPGQPPDPVLPVEPVAGPNRIIVKQKHRPDNEFPRLRGGCDVVLAHKDVSGKIPFG